EHLGTGTAPASALLATTPYVEEALRWLPESVQREQGSLNSEDSRLAPIRESTSAVLSSRVLVVDDYADMREYLKRLLSTSYQVLLAADGNTALALARGVRPDLI